MITEEDLLALASEIFQLPIERLSLDTAYGSEPEWDSVSHLRLVIESESKFGSQIPLNIIPELKTLRDLLDALNGGLV